MVDFILNEEYERCENNKHETEMAEELHPTMDIKFIDLAVSAGFGEYLDRDGNENYITVPDTPTTRRADFALKVKGDSMEPEYYDGDIVFVKKQQVIDIGQIGIFIINGEGYIKKFKGNYLESLNPNYPTIKLSESDYIKCVGLVIGKL